MAKNISEAEIWYKIITGLNRERLRYVLVGGAALVIYGMPRTTLDIDIYVPASEEVLNKLFETAHRLGLKTEQKDIAATRHLPNLFKDQWICFSYKGRDILDVFLADEKEFDKLYNNSEGRKIRNIGIMVASLKDIEKMKKKCRRPTDIADIEFIKKARQYKKPY